MNVIYFDTETTGLSPIKDEVTEIAAHSSTYDRSYVSFCKPTIPIPAESTAITGITNEMVADAPDFKTVAQEFIEFCGEGEVLMIAHNNIGFDMPFLREQFKKHELCMPNEWIFLDTLFWARYYRPDLPRHSLQYLRQIYGFAANQAHRALDDVIMLKQIFEVMIDDLPLNFVKEKLLFLQSSR